MTRGISDHSCTSDVSNISDISYISDIAYIGVVSISVMSSYIGVDGLVHFDRVEALSAISPICDISLLVMTSASFRSSESSNRRYLTNSEISPSVISRYQ
jgi:hypothetical protein